MDGRSDIPEANVSNLTAAEKHGRELFGQRCANCHTLKASNAVAQVGPNLDTLRPPENLVLDAIKNGRAPGNGQMAANLVEGEDAEDVAAYVAKAVGQTEQGIATPSARVPSVRFVISPRNLQGFPPLLRCGAVQPLSPRRSRGAGDPGRWGESPVA